MNFHNEVWEQKRENTSHGSTMMKSELLQARLHKFIRCSADIRACIMSMLQQTKFIYGHRSRNKFNQKTQCNAKWQPLDTVKSDLLIINIPVTWIAHWLWQRPVKYLNTKKISTTSNYRRYVQIRLQSWNLLHKN